MVIVCRTDEIWCYLRPVMLNGVYVMKSGGLVVLLMNGVDVMMLLVRVESGWLKTYGGRRDL